MRFFARRISSRTRDSVARDRLSQDRARARVEVERERKKPEAQETMGRPIE